MVGTTAQDLRNAFVQFFVERGHQQYPSASLVPLHDPSLLFTNAGMVPFKDYFLGLQVPPCSRAVSVQRCLRAGGKHNDLENVGYTARHHTFFEMLGNFSWGDYFKKEAITWAWEFLTQTLKLPPARLWVTVFLDDNESAEIWHREVGVPLDRIVRCGEKDNFWSMGDTGPCGPCTEIFYDHGASVPGSPPGTADADGDRFVEIWNIVFMQYNRDLQGQLHALPRPCVDTGMGLERLCAVMQGTAYNFETDGFAALLRKAEQLWRQTLDPSAQAQDLPDAVRVTCRVLADHMRATAFLIADGVTPGPEGRSYVLRRLMRRAMRHGHSIGLAFPFFSQLLEPLMQTVHAVYPELAQKQQEITATIEKEEALFARTLVHGLRILEDALAASTPALLSGEVAFKLYDTYGFPLDLTQDVLREKGWTVDVAGFETAMESQKKMSQNRQRFRTNYTQVEHWGNIEQPSFFAGYDTLSLQATVLGIHVDSESAGADLVLDKTPFYAQAGGQVGDTGHLCNPETGEIWATVTDTQRVGDKIVHRVQWPAESSAPTHWEGTTVRAVVHAERRLAIACHHSATHLLHAALRAHFGTAVQQRGSWVSDQKLRFDFTCPRSASPEDLRCIAEWVQQKILDNAPVTVREMPLAEAQASGALALFSEKYADNVRVLCIGEGVSLELCGGTHVQRTGDIGCFWILSESAVSAGVRRIEAVAGWPAWDYAMRRIRTVTELSQQFAVSPEEVSATVTSKLLSKKPHKTDAASGTGAQADCADFIVQCEAACQLFQLPDSAQQWGVVARVLPDGMDSTTVRKLVDDLKERLPHAVVCLLLRLPDTKWGVYVGVGQLAQAHYSALGVLQEILPTIQGKGGGRKDFAQGGGVFPAETLPEVLELVIRSVSQPAHRPSH